MSNAVQAKKSFFEGRKLWFVFAAVAAVLTAAVLFIIISSVTATTKYYILNQDVPARTEITESLLQEVIVSTGGQPPTALALNDILEGGLYSQYALDAGDIVTTSNAGPLTPINEGVPEGFVTATFTAPASMAVGGKIARGDYIDILAIKDGDGGQTATYALQHVLVLDATVNLDEYESTAKTTTDAEGNEIPADDSATRLGIPSMYTVALSPEDATKLGLMTQNTMYIVLSADQSSDNVIAPKDITKTNEDLGGETNDSGIGTDSTFGANKTETDGTDTGATDTENGTPTEPEPTTPE